MKNENGNEQNTENRRSDNSNVKKIKDMVKDIVNIIKPDKHEKIFKYLSRFGIILGVIGFVISCWSLNISLESLEITKEVRQNTERNLDINYNLLVDNDTEISDTLDEEAKKDTPSFMDVRYSINGSDFGESFTLSPILFSLDKLTTYSGDYLSVYFSYVVDDEVIINEFRESETGLYTAGSIVTPGAGEADVTFDSERDIEKFNGSEGQFEYLYGSGVELDGYYVVHIILKGYNGSYQFYTIIYYPDGYYDYKDEFENDEVISRVTNYQFEVIDDTSLYDKTNMLKIANAIWPDESEASGLINNRYSELKTRIENERKSIKEKLGE